MKNKRLIVILQIILVLMVRTVLSYEAFNRQPQGFSIEDKFNPQFTYDLLCNLSAQNPKEVVSTIVWLVEDEEKVGMNITQLKQYVTEVFTEQRNATVWYLAEVLPFIHIMVEASEVEKIAAYEFVNQINVNGDFMRPHLCLDVSVPTIRAHGVWGLGYRGSGVRIAIIDTGINQSHPDLDDLDDDPSTSDPKVIAERDFTGEGITVDSDGHGTHCAGIVAGTGAASNGVYKGVAPGAWLIEARVWNSTGHTDINWWTDAIDWAISNNADIISFSMGITYFDQNGNQIRTDGTYPPSPVADDAVDRGAVVIAAAGNFHWWANPNNYIVCPGDAFNVTTVGASDDNNTEGINDDTVLWWSSRGPTGDNRPKPDVVAPGTEIMSTWANYSSGTYYVSWSGTSMATPYVAGVAALLLEAYPKWTPDMVKKVIRGTTRLNDNLQDLTENDRGKGMVDAERALTCPIDVPADEADRKVENGFGIHIAQANLDGTYRVAAEAFEIFLVAWADAVLYKSYTPDEDMINPIFHFGFHDTGSLTVALGSAYFDAKLKLWDGENELFAYQERIHGLDIAGYYTTNCFHTIGYQYEGMLLAGHAYNIEYGFYAYATTYFLGFLSHVDISAQALSLSVMSESGPERVLGPGNPSFEQRLQLAPGVWGEPYWSINNEGWRELKGDINGDGKVRIDDVFAVQSAFGSQPGDPNWDPKCDLNGDGMVRVDDVLIAASEFGKNANPAHGGYCWYTSGGGDYAMTQWLCDFDVNALKGEQVTFTFWFKPDSAFPDWKQNYAQAEIRYVYDGNEGLEQGDQIYPTEETWYSVSVTATLPDNTEAIQIIICGVSDFHAWTDQTSITVNQ